MSTTNREVIYRIRVEGDAKSKAVFDGVAKAATGAEKKVKAAGDSAAQAAKVQQKSLDSAGKGFDFLARQREKMNQNEIRYAKESEARVAKQVTNERRAVEQSARNRTRANSLLLRSGKDMERSFDRTLGSVTQLGRAFATSGLVGEQSMQKVLNVLLAMEAVTLAIHGGTGLVRGIQGMGRAAAGRAAAQAAGGGAAGIAGQAAGGAAGSAAVSGVAKLIGRIGLRGVAKIAAGVAVAAVIYEKTRPTTPEEKEQEFQNEQDRLSGRSRRPPIQFPWLAGRGPATRDADTSESRFSGEDAFAFRQWQRNRAGGRLDKEAQMRERREALSTIVGRQANVAGSEAFRRTAADTKGQAEFASLRGAQASEASLMSSGGATGEQLVEARRRVLDIEEQIRSTRMAGARAELDLSRSSLDVAQQKEGLARERGLSIGERVGRLRPGEQSLVDRGARDIMARIPVTPEIRQLVERVAGDSPLLQQRLRELDLKNAGDFFNQGGLFDVLGLRRDEKVATLERQQIEGEVKVKNDITIKLEGEGESVAKQIIKQLEPLLAKRDEEEKKAILEFIRAAKREQEAQAAAQREAG